MTGFTPTGVTGFTPTGVVVVTLLVVVTLSVDCLTVGFGVEVLLLPGKCKSGRVRLQFEQRDPALRCMNEYLAKDWWMYVYE